MPLRDLIGRIGRGAQIGSSTGIPGGGLAGGIIGGIGGLLRRRPRRNANEMPTGRPTSGSAIGDAIRNLPSSFTQPPPTGGIFRPPPGSPFGPGGNGSRGIPPRAPSMPSSPGAALVGGLNVIERPTYRETIAPRPGYVAVVLPYDMGAHKAGAEVHMLKEVAKRLKLWKPRPKAALTAGDVKIIRRAKALENKLVRLTKANVDGVKVVKR